MIDALSPPFIYTFQLGDDASGEIAFVLNPAPGQTDAALIQFSIASAELRVAPAPEPAVLGLLGLGVAGLWRVRPRKFG